MGFDIKSWHVLKPYLKNKSYFENYKELTEVLSYKFDKLN